MTRPIAIVVGFIGKLPVAGMSLYNLHYIAGLQALGYEVHYVERQNVPSECYDPRLNDSTDDPGYALSYLERLMPQFGVPRGRFSFIDHENRCHGSTWAELRQVLSAADFVITLADPSILNGAQSQGEIRRWIAEEYGDEAKLSAEERSKSTRLNSSHG